jgi:hypothetical protein
MKSPPPTHLQSPSVHHHQTPELGDDGPSFHHDLGDENNESGGQESDEEGTLSSLGAPQPYKLSFQVVAEKATDLVRLAQSDPTTLGSLCDVLDQLTNRL